MDDTILLTIAIPTYNGGDNLIRAVKSCSYINLDFKEYEILVVDNCSNDDSIEKLRTLKKDFPNLRIEINEKNIGRINNWNKCLDISKGEYFIFLFSNDEIYSENNVKDIIEFNMKRNYPAVMFNTIYLDEIQNKKFYNYKTGEWTLENFINTVFVNNMSGFGILQSYMFDMQLIKENKIHFDNNLERTADRMFIFDVINTKKIFYISDSILSIWHLTKNRYHYSVHVDSNINLENLYEKFYSLWIQEAKADLYILEKYGYVENYSFRIFLSYIIKVYYKEVLKKNIRKLVFRNKNIPIDVLLLDVFVKYLEKYSEIKRYSKNFFLGLRISIFIKILIECFIKILKIIGIRFLKLAGFNHV